MRFGHVAPVSIEAERDWRKVMEDEAAGAEANAQIPIHASIGEAL
jgi:hypothetical protein